MSVELSLHRPQIALDAAAIQRLGVGRRSTVVALPAAMVLGEALRQTHHHETLA